jgi:hypothetical protein
MSMTETIEALREGDVYRWSFRDPKRSDWCCSRIAIVANCRLRDTFWQIGTNFSDGKAFSIADISDLELTRLGNMADFERAPEYQEDYYDDADIMDLNHSNSTRGNFYLRKGAQRSQAKMLLAAQYALETAESDERSAAYRAKLLREKIAKIKAGDIAGYI